MRRRVLVIACVAVVVLAATAGGAWHLLWRGGRPPRAPVSPDEAPAGSLRSPPRVKGQIRLSSAPAGAQIWLDGVDLGRSTPDLFSVHPRRRHGIRLLLEGYEAADLEIRLPPGETREIHVDLVRERHLERSDLLEAIGSDASRPGPAVFHPPDRR